ncbi:hypothetical protein FACS1894184_20700 [Clostridia bacterium]|nr:hypothetical protein FACS1894184_20700 [Clostridia bacterium]
MLNGFASTYDKLRELFKSIPEHRMNNRVLPYTKIPYIHIFIDLPEGLLVKDLPRVFSMVKPGIIIPLLQVLACNYMDTINRAMRKMAFNASRKKDCDIATQYYKGATLKGIAENYHVTGPNIGARLNKMGRIMNYTYGQLSIDPIQLVSAEKNGETFISIEDVESYFADI